METKHNAERKKYLKEEVKALGRKVSDYSYDLNTQNAYRIEQTKLGTYAYILVNNNGAGIEAKVDLKDFYTKRLYSYRWCRMSSDPKKDYPHTNIPDSNGKLMNLPLHVLIMGVIEDKVIDHNDGDHYNASRSNLNHVTTAQNNQNRHTASVNRYSNRSQVAARYVTLFA